MGLQRNQDYFENVLDSLWHIVKNNAEVLDVKFVHLAKAAHNEYYAHISQGIQELEQQLQELHDRVDELDTGSK